MFSENPGIIYWKDGLVSFKIIFNLHRLTSEHQVKAHESILEFHRLTSSHPVNKTMHLLRRNNSPGDCESSGESS